MADSTHNSSMDFLGQKRRVRPVRKVQVSTHFDELDILKTEASTPEPPRIDDAMIKEINPDIRSPNALEARSAVYAARPISPPAELNTLVPEDFNLVDFKFNDLKGKDHKEEVIKTDQHFALVEDKTEIMEAVADDNDSLKDGNHHIQAKPEEITSPMKDTPDSSPKRSDHSESMKKEENKNIIQPVVVALPIQSKTETPSSKQVETTIIREKGEENIEPYGIEDVKISDEPLRKVSEARKSIEGSQAVVVEKRDNSASVSEETSNKDIRPNSTEPADSKLPDNKEITAPPPLPTDTGHLVAIRDSMKPSLLPVKPVNGAPSVDTAEPTSGKSSPLAKSEINAEEIEALRKEIGQQKYALEKEIDSKKALELQIQAIVAKSNAQEETIHLKNENMDKLNTEFLQINKDLTCMRQEKEKLEESLSKAEYELSQTSDTNAKAFLEKSDEITELKDKLAEFAAIIGQKDKEIRSLETQLEEAKRANLSVALEQVHQYDKIEDDLIKMVEEEILRMQDTIEEQRKYNAKLQMEVDGEYSFWKRSLSGESNSE